MTFDVLRSLLPGIAIEEVAASDQLTIRVPVESLLDVCRTLHDHQELGYLFLADITAVDWWPREPRFEVVYHMSSLVHRLRVKVAVPNASVRVHTIQSVWPAAGWLEREVWDMFGIVFEEHGDLRRLLMPEDWEGHPLTKDFPVQIRMKPQSFEPLQVSEEEFRANIARDKAGRADAADQTRR